MSIAGVVLAGGKSSRMGVDKSQLKLGKKSLLQHGKQIIKDSGIKDIFISGKDGIQDSYEEKGPLAGILASLEKLDNYDHVLFTPVDMPMLNKYVFLKLISEKNQTVCYFENYFLPLLICNNAINKKIIKQQIINNKLSINNTLKQLEAKPIKNHFPENIFLNANTSSDWLEIQNL